MTWTHEHPKAEGWYFERTRETGSDYVRVLYVSCDSRGRWWAGSVCGSRGSRVRTGGGIEWAGPITMPEEGDR